MKIFKLTILLFSSIFIFSCNGKVQENKQTAQNKQNQIEVLDFYGTHRCVTCIEIEKNTRFTLDTYFSEALKSGKIVFKTINVDEKENENLAEQFEAAGTALFLNVIKDNKETHIDLTDFAFLDGTEQEVFSQKLKAKIEIELNKL